MDPNPGPVNPVPRPHDIAEPGPIDPATGQPDHRAEVSAVKSWLRQNALSLVITAVVVALVCVYLDPLDTLKVVLGLGLVIFIHELGHFVAAKWCDVHVKTFSIGFGPAVPFCSHKWGETTYMVGIIPLGGYVSMVGEGTGESVGPDADPEEEENDPRSFKQKSVGQRMLIISAGVIMNVILGMGCFMAAYLHGVREEPATVGSVASGSAAWRAGVRTDGDIKKIGSRENPVFKDLRPIVMSSSKGEQIPVEIEYNGKRETVTVEPLREEGAYFPTLGVTSTWRMSLLAGSKRTKGRPVIPGSPAAKAEPRFEPGDRIVAMTDPADPAKVTPIPPDPRDPGAGPEFKEYHRRMVLLAGRPVTFHVLRKDQDAAAAPTAMTVEPAYRADLGVRMRMGEVIALRRGGPAEQAGVRARAIDGPETGDKIKVVKLPEAGGAQTWFVAGEVKPVPKDVTVKPLDPVLLPLELQKWALRNAADRRVELVVLRREGHVENAEATLKLTYDDSFRFDRELVVNPSSPLPLSGLGLAYWVEGIVNDVIPGGPAADPDPADPTAARPGPLKTDDIVTAVRFKALDDAGAVKPGEWNDIKPYQWASVEAAFQRGPPYEIDLRLKRGEQVIEVTLKGKEDKEWPTEERGLNFQSDFRTQKAGDVGDALNLGARRTVRFIKEVYMNLYGMVSPSGRISSKTMSGPLTIATVSYKFAGEDFWQFLLFLGMISVNLAVVNFLPIPVLDGGHMVFLLYERITGRPVPERLFAIAMYTGLALILSLMVYVLFLDVQRLFF